MRGAAQGSWEELMVRQRTLALERGYLSLIKESNEVRVGPILAAL